MNRNSSPGELDGARVAAGLWGRRAGTALSTITLFVLGVGAYHAVKLPCDQVLPLDTPAGN